MPNVIITPISIINVTRKNTMIWAERSGTSLGVVVVNPHVGVHGHVHVMTVHTFRWKAARASREARALRNVGTPRAVRITARVRVRVEVHVHIVDIVGVHQVRPLDDAVAEFAELAHQVRQVVKVATLARRRMRNRDGR